MLLAWLGWPGELAAQQAAAGAATDGEAASRSGDALPLRLTLLDPRGVAALPSSFTCQDTPEEASRVQAEIQEQARSLALTSRVTLHAFSRWGCPRSAGAALGLTHAVRLGPRLRWVLAAGVAGFPQAAQRGWLLRPSLRSDLVWTTRDGQTRSVGVDATQLLRSAVKAGAQRRVGASVSGSF